MTERTQNCESLNMLQCSSCQQWLRMDSEDLINTTCQLCGGEID